MSQSWISRLVKRYRLEGEAAFEPRSRRPHRSPTRLPQPTIDLIAELRQTLAGKGLDHGPHTIAWHLQHHHRLAVSVASIHRHLRACGPITPQPQKRPKASYIRFAAEQPNERWKADFTHWWLADRTHVKIPATEVFCADHLRLALDAAVRGGGDTDTMAAIAGGLLGAAYGGSAIPAEWHRVLHGWPGLSSRDLVGLASTITRNGRPDDSV